MLPERKTLVRSIIPPFDWTAPDRFQGLIPSVHSHVPWLFDEILADDALPRLERLRNHFQAITFSRLERNGLLSHLDCGCQVLDLRLSYRFQRFFSGVWSFR